MEVLPNPRRPAWQYFREKSSFEKCLADLSKLSSLVGLGMSCHLELAINPFMENGSLDTTV